MDGHTASSHRLTLQRAVTATTLIVLAVGAVLVAQQPAHRASPAGSVRSVWDGVYAEQQAERGLLSYRRSCARCHALSDGAVPRRFIGDAFWTAWGEDSLASLYTSVRNNMPADFPGSLSETTNLDIIAFLLQANAIPAGFDELTVDGLRTIRVARRDSDGSLPAGAFVAVSGCLTKAAKGWTLTSATTPERFRGGDVAIDAPRLAEQPAGSAAFDLLFGVSSLDKMEGHRVLVRGLLVRAPADGINVTSVQSLAGLCAP
ncbi:MAG: hypothetical protein H0T71_02900 [Acidobacteria bacterium]|nr:hypothetical protein [Acidobacteriota bacterium]